MVKNMDMENSEYRQPEIFKFDTRSEWYQVSNFLLELAQASKLLNLKPEDIIHLGGTASFYRTYQAFGPKATAHYRGTHDMDIVSFRPGILQQTLDLLINLHDQESKKTQAPKHPNRPEIHKGQARLHRVRGYSTRKSLGLPDKKSVYLAFDYTDNPGASSGFELDVFESDTNQIRFNNRIFTKTKIVLDKPESLTLQTLSAQDRGSISVPSLRDYLIIKTDIMDFSNQGLRTKDQFDILVTLSICQELGHDFKDLVNGIILANRKPALQKRLRGLEKLFQNPLHSLSQIPQDYPFLPNQKLTKHALDIVQQALKFT